MQVFNIERIACNSARLRPDDKYVLDIMPDEKSLLRTYRSTLLGSQFSADPRKELKENVIFASEKQHSWFQYNLEMAKFILSLLVATDAECIPSTCIYVNRYHCKTTTKQH